MIMNHLGEPGVSSFEGGTLKFFCRDWRKLSRSQGRRKQLRCLLTNMFTESASRNAKIEFTVILYA
jgi:hypothetical protein